MHVGLKNLHIHPGWTDKSDGSGNNSDFCLIELPSSVKKLQMDNCGSEICATRICLPTQNAPAGAACWVGGWGLDNYAKETSPDSLKSVGVNIFSEAYSKLKIKPSIYQGIVFKDEFAAGLPDRNGDGLTDAGSDACSGDSGGPLVCRDGDNLVLYGLTSWGVSCGKTGSPGIYAQVFAAMSWVDEKIGSQVTPTRVCIVILKNQMCLIFYIVFHYNFHNTRINYSNLEHWNYQRFLPKYEDPDVNLITFFYNLFLPYTDLEKIAKRYKLKSGW